MDNVNKRLQETREKEIPQIIDKYKSLIDGIFEQVSKPFPTFRDISKKDENDESYVVISAEEQQYNFMLMREKAIDHADRMLNKINELELEKNAPEIFKALKNENLVEEVKKSEPARKRNIAKEMAQKKS